MIDLKRATEAFINEMYGRELPPRVLAYLNQGLLAAKEFLQEPPDERVKEMLILLAKNTEGPSRAAVEVIWNRLGYGSHVRLDWVAPAEAGQDTPLYSAGTDICHFCGGPMPCYCEQNLNADPSKEWGKCGKCKSLAEQAVEAKREMAQRKVICDASPNPHSYAICSCSDGHTNPRLVEEAAPPQPAPALTQTVHLLRRERVAQLIAHRACCGSEHDPQNGKLHGCCIVCGVPWPCKYAGKSQEPPSCTCVLSGSQRCEIHGPFFNSSQAQPAPQDVIDVAKKMLTAWYGDTEGMPPWDDLQIGNMVDAYRIAEEHRDGEWEQVIAEWAQNVGTGSMNHGLGLPPKECASQIKRRLASRRTPEKKEPTLQEKLATLLSKWHNEDTADTMAAEICAMVKGEK